MSEAYIVAATRTAGGRRGGRLSGWHPVDLAAQVIDALLERSGADPALVDPGVTAQMERLIAEAESQGRTVVIGADPAMTEICDMLDRDPVAGFTVVEFEGLDHLRVAKGQKRAQLNV